MPPRRAAAGAAPPPAEYSWGVGAFAVGARYFYWDAHAATVCDAVVLRVDDTVTPPCYTVQLSGSARTRDTEASRLAPMVPPSTTLRRAPSAAAARSPSPPLRRAPSARRAGQLSPAPSARADAQALAVRTA
jgi:hypothetical protein